VFAFESLPREAHAVVLGHGKHLFTSFKRAVEARDEQLKHTSLLAILKFPSIGLRKCRGGGKKLAYHLGKQLADAQGELNRLLSGSPPPSQRPSPSPEALPRLQPSNARGPAAQPSTPTLKAVRRATMKAKAGHMSAAAKTLLNDAPLTLTQSVVDQLKDLHPPSSGALPQAPADRPLVHVEEERVEQLLLKLASKGSAGGPSGWTGDTLKIFWSDESCRASICLILDGILNDTFDAVAKELLLSCTLIALPKKAGGIRPIAMGEVFVKLACLYGLALIKGHLSKLLPSIQFGVGVSGGSEKAVHTLQGALSYSHPNAVLLSCDITNAFNTVRRPDIASELFRHEEAAPCWSLFRFLYDTASPLLLYDDTFKLREVVRSEEGVRQGCAFSSFAFALAMQPLYEASVRDLPNLVPVAVLDDFNVVGEPSSVFSSFDRFAAECKAHHLTLNVSKSFILWTHQSEPSSQIIEDAKSRGLEIKRGSAAQLGTILGYDREAVSAYAMRTVERQKRLHAALRHPRMPAQIALHILRASVLARPNYLSRVTNPLLIPDVLQELDEQTLDTASAILGLPAHLPDVAHHQLSLPVRLGGLGLRSFVQSAPLAFLASATQALPLLQSARTQWLADHDNLDNTPYGLALSGVLRVVASQGVTKELPADAASLWSTFGVPHDPFKLQHLWTVDRHTRLVQHIFSTASKPDVARLRSASGKRAYRWLTVIPHSAAVTLNNAHFAIAVRHLLGLPLAQPVRCLCGEVTDQTDHFHACVRLRRTAANTRHNIILYRLAQLCKEAGHAVLVEPNLYNKDDPASSNSHALRPDMSSVGLRSTFFIDVSVTHPCCESFVLSAASLHLSAAELRAQQKRIKYGSFAKRHGGVFVPFVFESYGSMAKQSSRFLRMLAKDAESFCGRPESSFLADAAARLSVGLQLGNAILVQHASCLARSGGRAPSPSAA